MITTESGNMGRSGDMATGHPFNGINGKPNVSNGHYEYPSAPQPTHLPDSCREFDDHDSAKSFSAPDFTSQVIAATGPQAHPRLAQIMPALLRHLHDFAREVNLTVGEWMAGVEFINQAGRMSNDSRNETQLICDILGLESLVDELTATQIASSSRATSSAILGPFHRPGAPVMPNGSNIVASSKREEYAPSATFLSGRVLDDYGQPVAGAMVDVWHTAPNGMYEQQDPEQPEMNLRGRFRTDDQGCYSLYCLRPVPYPIPFDGPGGQLLRLLDRHPYRPAHIHFIVDAPGYRPLVTQIFDREDKYLVDDSVFAVKEDLVVDYLPRRGDPSARWTLSYDFVLTEDLD